MRNASGETSFFYPDACAPFIPPRLCSTQTVLAAGVTAKPVLRHVTDGRPVVLNVTKSLADQIFVQLRVHDLSRRGESYGTELPIVRESAMKTGRAEILDVPLDPRFRTLLRVYALGVQKQGALTVRIIGTTTDERTYVVKPIDGPEGEPYAFPDFYRQIGDLSTLVGGETARIELIGDVPFRAFVTVTNNEEHHVTTLVTR